MLLNPLKVSGYFILRNAIFNINILILSYHLRFNPPRKVFNVYFQNKILYELITSLISVMSHSSHQLGFLSKYFS